MWDSTRTDAPADGVHIVLYERGLDGSFGSTPIGLHILIPNFGLDATSLAMTLEVTAGEHVVRIDLVESTNSAVASGKVYVDDYQVGVLDPGSSQVITDPSGGPVAPQLLEYFGAVATLASHIPVGVDLWANVQILVSSRAVLA